MAKADHFRCILNPCLLQLQKMSLELKCPFCLNLLWRPILLPCNHILCSHCVPEVGSSCLVCKTPFTRQDLRSAPHMENMVSIYKSMEAAFNSFNYSSTSQPDPLNLDEKSRSEPHIMPFTLGEELGPDSTLPLKGESETPERPTKYPKVGDGIRSVECNVNQWAQASPGSPPLLDDMKDSEDEKKDEESGNPSSKKSLTKSSVMNVTYDGNNLEETNFQPSHGGHSFGEHEAWGKLNVDSIFLSEEGLASKKGVIKSEFECHNVQFDVSKNANRNIFECAFCQSSDESEASGSMFHYSNGRALNADQAARANVLHVHKKCAEWAPQVYFLGDTIMNLESELDRGSKIKCSSCGKKGAALGCYVKSCRKSFHVPCAVNIAECRWDCVNFLMFCPIHSSHKLPCEKSKSRKNELPKSIKMQPTYSVTPEGSPSVPVSQQSKLWVACSSVTSKWVLCGSALSSVEKDLLAEFASLTGTTLAKYWNPNVTHVIASTDDNGACSRTLKFLLGILNGSWILKIDWIKACMEAKHPVDEEPHEVQLDIHGCVGGPKNGRIRVLEEAPKLFSGLNFCFTGDFLPSYKGYLTDLVAGGGGNVLPDKDIICPDLNTVTKSGLSAIILIYNADTPQNCESVEQRHHEAEALAAKIGSQVAPHLWLLESIAACKLQPLPF